MKTQASHQKRGAFITFEGPEGCGKSTQVRILADRIKTEGLPVLCTREPGGTRTGELIRDILQHDKADEPLVPEAEMMLFLASRAQLVRQTILPALESGTWVISDRFMDSTVAYQGYGRGFGPERVMAFNAFVVGPAIPDMTLLLDLDVKDGFERMAERNRRTGEAHDRMERETVEFHERMRQGYLDLARRMPDRIRVIPAGGSPEAVAREIWKAVCDVLGCTNAKSV
jgi:dTMP kinase